MMLNEALEDRVVKDVCVKIDDYSAHLHFSFRAMFCREVSIYDQIVVVVVC